MCWRKSARECLTSAQTGPRIIAAMQSHSLQGHSLPTESTAQPPAELRMLPRSRVACVVVWTVIGVLSALTFAAWLQPNMVFDLANMVICF